MAATSTIVADPALQRVLDAAQQARAQCLALLDMLDARLAEDPAPPSRQFELELSRQQQKLNSYLAQVRGLNRGAILGVRQTKQATAEARSEVDTLLLQLQNLSYEQRHLRGEIAACQGYEHKYQQLPLINTDEFIAENPEHAEDDEHTLMVARINHEHAMRVDLEEQRQALLKKKQGLIAENKKRKEDLANLDKDLEKFIEAAGPIEKIFEKHY